MPVRFPPPLVRAVRAVAAALALVAGPAAGPAAAQIYRVADLTAPQIRALDRTRTVVLLPGGVLEEHGPHLPSFTDGYVNAWVTERLAEALVARPGWAVLVFPMMPVGDGGFNEATARYTFPGTYGVRTATLRALYMDLGTELGDQGFRWAFIVHGHGSPLHNEALHEAGDYFRDTYGGHMVHLLGFDDLPPAPGVRPADGSALTAAEEREVGIDPHAGYGETSRLLFVRPDLVDRGFRQLPPITVGPTDLQRGMAGLQAIAAIRAADWPGYVSSPRLANAAHGAFTLQDRASRAIAVALRILDGLDERTLPRGPGDPKTRTPIYVDAARASTAHFAEVERRERAWLKRRGIAP